VCGKLEEKTGKSFNVRRTLVAGTHTLTCGVGTIPAGFDPNKSNNLMSTTFTVTASAITELTYNTLPGIVTSSSNSVQTTLIGISIPSMNIFDYTTTLNAPAGTGDSLLPGTVDAGKCTNTTVCVITIDKLYETANGCAEYCGHAVCLWVVLSRFERITVSMAVSESPILRTEKDFEIMRRCNVLKSNRIDMRSNVRFSSHTA
jgi:hypothetical protein